ncbi:MAG: GDSL-type esterase/lipase family protein [Archangium sp.]|nr:GDSL-type esterase/lipase family protein [Archangium sp.]MDP3572956.1 GDSL-type esterase/lipase family protein [Archangium sp.]
MALPNITLKRLPPRAPPTAGPPVLRREGPPIGRTFFTTIVLALVLSVLPLPDALRPFPKLRASPKDTLARLVWPHRAGAGVAQPPLPVLETIEVALEDDAPGMVFEALDLTGEFPEPHRTKNVEAKRWDVLLARVQAPHSSIVDACLDERCSATALSPWFAALDELEAPVRVVTVGTSLIASDHITDVLRRRLQQRYGDAGQGFLFIDRPTRNAGRTVRSGTATEGWLIEKVTDATPLALGGLGGVAFTAAADAPQTTSYLASGARRLELFAVAQQNPGVVQVLGDGQMLGELDTRGTPGQPSFPSLALPEGITEVMLRTRRGAVRLDGVVLEREAPGVVVDSLGLPGGSATVLLVENEALFSAQLQAREPSLVILMLGGNDAFDLSLNRYSLATARERMQTVIDRVRTAAPGAACLLASPPDAGIWRMDQTLTPRTQTRLVAAYMGELARENGCAWYDMQAAMGGEGSIERWWSAGLMNRDLVHPLALGGDLMGYQLDEALENARREHRARTREVGALNGGRRAPPLRCKSRRVKQKAPHPPVPPGEVDANGGPFLSIHRRGRNNSREVERPTGEGADAGIIEEAPVCEPDGGTAAPDAGYLVHPEVLSRFFARLRALEKDGTGRVAIMQLGASHTAAHTFTDESRLQLATRFGSSGRGFVAAGQASPRLERAGVWRSLFGHWSITDALKLRTSSLVWGLTGVRAEASPGASMTMSFDEPLGTEADTARLQVYYLEEPGALPPEVIIDGTLVPLIMGPPADTRGVRVLEFAAPGHRHVVSVSNPGPGPMSFFGVAHELMKPGIVYDALGLPGSTASTLASYEQGALMQQVSARQPDLFVFFFGTNESGLSQSHVEEMTASYPPLFTTLRQAAPEADCLILAPTDRMRFKRDGKGWREAESIGEVTIAMEQIALEQGCAFWRTREVMGGKGSIEKWRKKKLAHADHVHLTTEGYQKLSRTFIEALLGAYDGWSPPP